MSQLQPDGFLSRALLPPGALFALLSLPCSLISPSARVLTISSPNLPFPMLMRHYWQSLGLLDHFYLALPILCTAQPCLALHDHLQPRSKISTSAIFTPRPTQAPHLTATTISSSTCPLSAILDHFWHTLAISDSSFIFNCA